MRQEYERCHFGIIVKELSAEHNSIFTYVIFVIFEQNRHKSK